nr:MAG TPA: hypothetical protein [Caudoviricetes sp.]
MSKVDIQKDTIQKLFDLALVENKNIGELTVELFEEYINDKIYKFTGRHDIKYSIKHSVSIRIPKLTIDLFASNIINGSNSTLESIATGKEVIKKYYGDVDKYITCIDEFTIIQIEEGFRDSKTTMEAQDSFKYIKEEMELFKQMGINYYKEISVFATPDSFHGV